MADAILYENRGRVALITLNRPESRNAINREVREGLTAAWQRFANDGEARVAILTGAGDKASVRERTSKKWRNPSSAACRATFCRHSTSTFMCPSQ